LRVEALKPRAVQNVLDPLAKGQAPIDPEALAKEVERHLDAQPRSSGSVDVGLSRKGKDLIETAEREGLLQPGGTVVEATAGNTGLGLAANAIAGLPLERLLRPLLPFVAVVSGCLLIVSFGPKLSLALRDQIYR